MASSFRFPRASDCGESILTTPLQTYLAHLYEIRSSGGAFKETAYYPALSNLLNEVGKTLKPRVRCIMNIRSEGAGLPDGGLYSVEQFQKRTKRELREGQLPERGAIEVKSTGEEVDPVVRSEQVVRYVNRYKQVLVTDYRDSVLVGVDHHAKLTNRESFSLAANEKAFWLAASDPQAAAEHHGERFVEYLKRVMLHAARLALPKDVALFLVSYARDARARIESSNLPALMTVRSARTLHVPMIKAYSIRFATLLNCAYSISSKCSTGLRTFSIASIARPFFENFEESHTV
jgi:hypothetical protein